MSFKKLLLPLFLVLFLLKAEKSLATHVMGNSLTYEYLSPNQYKVTLKLYQDCNVGIGPSLFAAPVCYSSVSLGSGIITLDTIPGTGIEILPVSCLIPGAVSSCQGGTGLGIKEWIYQGIVILPGAATDWIFSFDLCCRANQITTITPPGGNSMFLYAKLNNLTYPVNSSVQITNSFLAQYCLNTLSTYSFTSFDPDGDSLVYSLAPVQQGPGCPGNIINVPYILPYSATNPLSSSTPLIFNSSNGSLTFTPNILHVPILGILVQEYRNGILIGEVKKEEILYIVNGVADPDLIKGKVYFDTNNNQVYDAGEVGVYGQIIEAQPGGYYGGTNNFGDYIVPVIPGTYTATLPNLFPYYAAQPASHTATFTAVYQTDSLNDFGLIVSDSAQDLRVTLTGTLTFGIGQNRLLNLNCFNAGTDPMTGTVNLIHDNLISYVSGSPPPIAINGDTVTWGFNNLIPLTSVSINATFHLQAGTPIGTPLISFAEILPVINDSIPINNYDTLLQAAVVACDPNFKVVEPSTPITTAQITNGQLLEYTIHFQNTGTATAINVTITDTLDLNFNIPTFEVLGASHTYTWNITGQGIIEFSFLNIMLPDSGTNEPASHGFIKYRIKPKNNLVPGDKMLNTAYIFFDSNPAVVTNTTSTTVINPTSINELPQNISDIIIYPNPAKDILNIEMNLKKSSTVRFEIFNTLGLLIDNSENAFHAGLNKKQINMNTFSPGVYFIHITEEKASGFYKVIKQ